MFITNCPHCSRCGCDCGKLPYTVTLEFSGLVNKSGALHQTGLNNTYDCTLAAEACFGSGARAIITEPGGCFPGLMNEYCDGTQSDYGPITEVKLIDVGECYAKLGRVAPTVTAKSKPEGGVEGCGSVSLSVVLESRLLDCAGSEIDENGQDCLDWLEPDCNPRIPYWYIDSIEVGSVQGVCGYKDIQQIEISVAEGDVVVWRAEWELLSSGGIPQSTRPVGGETQEPWLNEKNGRYYRESKSEPPYVAEVRFKLDSLCLNEFGEESVIDIRGIVDENTNSKTFGQVTGVQILNPGTSWLAWTWRYICLRRQNQQEFVIRASDPHRLVTYELDSCFGDGLCIESVPIGDRIPPEKLFFVDASFLGCGGQFSYTIVSTKTSTGEPAWKIGSFSASGGKYWGSIASAEDTSQCFEYEEQPFVSLSRNAQGVIQSGTILSAGKFWVQLPYDGDPSPIRKLEIINGGSGYAKFGRVEPEIEFFLIGIFDINITQFIEYELEQFQDDCDVDFWEIKSVGPKGDGIPRFAANILRSFSRKGPTLEIEPRPKDGSSADRLGRIRVTRDNPEGQVWEPDVYELFDGGIYYKEDQNLPPYVTQYLVKEIQLEPSSGQDAQIKVTIDTDTFSGTFGQVVKAVIVDGGSGYTLAGGPKDCKYEGPCSHLLTLDMLRYGGNGARPDDIFFTLSHSTGCSGFYPNQAAFSSAVSSNNCDTNIDGGLSLYYGGHGASPTAKVSPGGKYEPCLIGSGQHDCGYCPDFRNLCITATLTDRFGNVHAISTPCDLRVGHDVNRCDSWFQVQKRYNVAGGFWEETAHSILVVCDSGKISAIVTGGLTGDPEEPPLPEGCEGCTAWGGKGSIECTEQEDWYVGVINITLTAEDDPFCEGCGPFGSVTVEITKC